MSNQANVEAKYTLQSSELIHTPGILAWAINGYAFEKDRATIQRMFTEGYKLPADIAHKLLSKEITYTVEDSNVVFYA